MKITRLSVSRMQTFETCPYKYRLRYHDQIEPKRTSPASEFGKWIHKGLEMHVSKGMDIQEALKSCLDDYTFPSSYLSRVKPILRHFEEVNGNLPRGDTELEFSIDVGASVPLVGVIDRMIPGEDGLLVLDYKTGTWEKTSKQLVLDNQMMMYAFAAHHLTELPYEHIRLALFYLLSGNLVPTKFEDEQVDRFVEILKRKIREIEEADPERAKAKVNKFCNWCEYQPMCETYKKYQALRNG